MIERGFKKEEFQTRCKIAQEMMKEKNVNAMLVNTEAEVRYYTGFHTPFWLSPTRPWFVIIPQSREPIAVIPTIGEECMKNTWVKDIRTWNAPSPHDDGVSLLCETLCEIAGENGKIGMPMGHETQLRMPVNDFDRIRQKIGFDRFVDATDIVRNQRMVKSEKEIEKIKYICNVTSQTFAQLPEFVNVGMNEIEVFKKMKIELMKNGADEVPYLVGGSGSGGFNDVIKQPSMRKIEMGDMMMLDTGATFDGYYCDFDRNYVFGKPSDEIKKAYEIVYNTTQAGIDAAKPGATTTDLYNAMVKVMTKNGGSAGDVGRLGHGLGMQLTEWPSHTKDDNTMLTENMVITIEPGMMFGDNSIMLHEENIVVREKGAELLSRRAPQEITSIT